jgi:hypothetical protein
MKQKITGNKYNYLIELSEQRIFQILCICKMDKSKKSAITNVNAIIGEILQPVLGTDEIEDSFVDVDSRIGKNLFSSAVEIFKDKNWLCYLEKNLDEDIEQGGWNSDFKF